MDIVQAPVTFGRVTDWNAWLVKWLKIDEQLQAKEDEKRKRLIGRPLESGEGQKIMEEIESQPVEILHTDILKVYQSREACEELGKILFIREDGQSATYAETRGLEIETVFHALFFLNSQSEMLTLMLQGYVPNTISNLAE